MRKKRGGTKKWCPYCKATRVCKAVNPSILGKKSGQRWYKIDYADIQWFRRGLICQTCDKRWLTAEIHEKYLNELVQLRDSLSEIKENTEAYLKKSENATNSLTTLAESLNKLRALKRYKKQD